MSKRRSNQQNKSAPVAPPENEAPAGVPAPEGKPVIRAGTKPALLLELLQREGGASLEEMATATGWLPHTTRAALTGLRKRKFAVEKMKTDSGTRYRIQSA